MKWKFLKGRGRDQLTLCRGQVVHQVTEDIVLHEALKGQALAWIGHHSFARILILAMAKRCFERLHRMIEVVHVSKGASQIVVEHRVGGVGLYSLLIYGLCLLEMTGHPIGHT